MDTGGTVVEGEPVRDRVLAVDLARGLALLGMMAVHVFPGFDDTGAPTEATWLAGGRSAATFALLAGVSLTFLSGGRQPLHGRTRVAASAGIAARAVLIGAVGLALGGSEHAAVILPYYAVLFLLALPLLGLRTRTLVGLTGGLLAVAPVVLVLSYRAEQPAGPNPTFGFLLDDPLGLLGQLLFSGSYPAIAYLAYLVAGMAIGRADLSSARLARGLLLGGLALAVTAWWASSVLLFRLGGLAHLWPAAGGPEGAAGPVQRILWDPVPTPLVGWWWLALRAPHSNATLDLLHTLGSAMAVLGLLLLVGRVPALRRAMWPLSAAGGMTLTFYSAHLILLDSGLLADHPAGQYLVLVAGVLLLGPVLRRTLGRGPLEWLVGGAAGLVGRLADRRVRQAACSSSRPVRVNVAGPGDPPGTAISPAPANRDPAN